MRGRVRGWPTRRVMSVGGKRVVHRSVTMRMRTGRGQETEWGTDMYRERYAKQLTGRNCGRAITTIGPSSESAQYHRMRRDATQQSMAPTTKTSPVIVITGTPGTGKSTHAELLVGESPVPLRHINVSEFVKEKELYENFDSEWESYIVDEDKARTWRYGGRIVLVDVFVS